MLRGGESSLKDERTAGGGLMADRCSSYYSRIIQGEGGADLAFVHDFCALLHLRNREPVNVPIKQSHNVKSGVPTLTGCQNKIIE